MSLAKLFGKKEKKEPKNQDKAQERELMLDQKIKELELRLENIEKKIYPLHDEAKTKVRAGDKAGAKRILAKKKKYVDLEKQIEGAIVMMEEQKLMLSNLSRQIYIMEAIKRCNKVLEEVQKGLTVEDIEDIKGKMEELKLNQDEIADFFKDYNQEYEEDIEEELVLLEEEIAKEDAGAMPVSNNDHLGPMPAEKTTNEEVDLNDFLNV